MVFTCLFAVANDLHTALELWGENDVADDCQFDVTPYVHAIDENDLIT